MWSFWAKAAALLLISQKAKASISDVPPVTQNLLPTAPPTLESPGADLVTPLLVVPEGMQLVEIPPHLQALISPDSQSRVLSTDRFLFTTAQARSVQKTVDSIAEYRDNLRQAPSLNPDNVGAEHKTFIVRIPQESISSSKSGRALRTTEARTLSEDAILNILTSPVAAESAAVLPTSSLRASAKDSADKKHAPKVTDTLEIEAAGVTSYLLDLSELSPAERQLKLQQVISDTKDLGGVVEFDAPLNIANQHSDMDTQNLQSQLLNVQRELAAANLAYELSLDRCMWILDSCSLSVDEWESYGLLPGQVRYLDQLCTPGYNRHGAAAMWTALSADREASISFISVFDANGSGTIGRLEYAYSKAMSQLLEEQAKGNCLDYAGTSFSGSMHGVSDALIKSSMRLMKSLPFHLSTHASGNWNFRNVCDQEMYAAVAAEIKAQNIPTPFRVISAYAKVSNYGVEGKAIPSYANLDAEPGACVAALVKTYTPVPDGVYSNRVFGGTSGSTALSNGLGSYVIKQLKNLGIETDLKSVLKVLDLLALQSTDPRVIIGESTPQDIKGLDTIPIDPMRQLFDEEAIAVAINQLLNNQTPKPTRRATTIPTAKVTGAPITPPTNSPVVPPTVRPTAKPTRAATGKPTLRPTGNPTEHIAVTSAPVAPVQPATTSAPTLDSTSAPTSPIEQPAPPTAAPTNATADQTGGGGDNLPAIGISISLVAVALIGACAAYKKREEIIKVLRARMDAIGVKQAENSGNAPAQAEAQSASDTRSVTSHATAATAPQLRSRGEAAATVPSTVAASSIVLANQPLPKPPAAASSNAVTTPAAGTAPVVASPPPRPVVSAASDVAAKLPKPVKPTDTFAPISVAAMIQAREAAANQAAAQAAPKPANATAPKPAAAAPVSKPAAATPKKPPRPWPPQAAATEPPPKPPIAFSNNAPVRKGLPTWPPAKQEQPKPPPQKR